MIIKKYKNLLMSIMILNLFILNVFSADQSNKNANPIENTQDNSLNNSNEIINLNENIELVDAIVPFDIYKKLMNEMTQLFESIIQQYMIDNNMTQESIMRLFEELNFNKIQPIILKLMNNTKNQKESKDIIPGTMQELKNFLLFLNNFIIKINGKSAENLIIDQATSTTELLNIIESLKKNNINLENLPKKIELDEFKEIIEHLSSMLDSMKILINNILSSIKKGKYIDNGIYNSIFHPGKKKRNKKNIRITEFQNEFLLPFLQHLNGEIQKKQLLLHEINILINEIAEDKLKLFSQEILHECLNSIATIQYFLDESKFCPTSGQFSIENKDMVDKEVMRIQERTANKYKTLIQKYKFQDIKSTQKLPTKKLLHDIKNTQKIISEYIKIELESTLFKIQNYYRKFVFSLEDLGNFHDGTKFIRSIIQPENWFTIAATYIGFDSYLWLSGKKHYGAVQSIFKTFVDGYWFINLAGGKDSDKSHDAQFMHQSPIEQTMIYHTNLLEKYLNNSFEDKLASTVGLQKINKTTTDTLTSLDLNIPGATKMYENSKIYSLMCSTPEKNYQIQESQKLVSRSAMLTKEYNKILSQSQHIEAINLSINNNILNSWGNRAEKLRDACNKNGIDERNIEIYEEIIRLSDAKESLTNDCANFNKIYTAQCILNNRRDSIGQALNSLPAGIGPVIGAGVLGFVAKKGLDYADTQGFNHYFKVFWKKFHYFMMGEEYKNENDYRETIDTNNSSFPHDINDKTFKIFEEQGILVWFKEVLNYIEASCNGKIYNGGEKISKCIGLFGPSGSGKTFLARALANHIDKILKESKSNVAVQFLAIDPKHFNGIIQNGQTTKLDIINELDGLLEEIRLRGGFYIIHLDEFHLFFTKDGKVSQERLADLLKFFNDLFVKQKSYKRVGGMYVICSTNKPQFIPHEFFDNGDRIGEVVEIKYPNGEQIISILKTELTNNNIITEHIDFNYLRSLVEGYQLTYGTIIKIANKAFNIAKIKNRMVDNDILYYAINDVIRKIILNDNESNTYLKDNKIHNATSLYYSALAAVAINFNHENNNIYDFDMVTILPLKQNFTPQHIDRLYLKPKIEPIQYGGAFYAKTNNLNNYNANTIAIKIIKAIAPTVYLDNEKESKINKPDELSNVYNILYNYYASKIEYIDCAKSIDIANEKRNLGQDINISDFNSIYNNSELNKQISKVLKQAEKALIEFYNNQEVKDFIKEVNQLLKENKIVTKKDILQNSSCKNLIDKLNKLFELLLTDISNTLL